MSLQHSGQRSWRFGSPSSSASRGCEALRATKSFGLGSASDVLSVSSSSYSTPLTLNCASYDAGNNRSASSTVWTEKLASPIYPGLSREKKSIRGQGDTIRRSASFDTIASSYLWGEWPRSIHPVIHLNLVHCPIVLTSDKWTQTMDDMEYQEMDGLMQQPMQKPMEAPCDTCGSCSREVPYSVSDCSHGLANLRMRPRSCHSARVSPLACFVCGGSPASVSDLSSATREFPSLIPRSKAVVIPVVNRRNPLAPCQGSAEGFNQEIEKLVRNTGTSDSDLGQGLLSKTQAQPPDGHRAPIADLLNIRSVNTQTPSGGLLHSGIEKHFLRILEDKSDDSPSLPIIPGAGDAPLLFNRPASAESDKSDQCEQVIREMVSSDSFIPLVKTYEKREAPEGCEEIEVEFAKTTEVPVRREIYRELPSPTKTSSFFKCLIPSEHSAFCPLLKKYVSQQTLLAFSLAANENDNSIEAK